MATMQKLRAYRGPELFSHGFRPFFLFGAVYAGAMVPLWLVVFAGDIALPTAFAPRTGMSMRCCSAMSAR